MRRIADRALADSGIERRGIMEVSSVDFALLLVAENAGVSLLPEIMADYANGVTFVPLASPISAWEFFMSFVGDEPQAPAAKAFFAVLQSASLDAKHEGRRL
jgi:DNA-binding transcriptional LysR family regulator